jgi:hypothetical protein
VAEADGPKGARSDESCGSAKVAVNNNGNQRRRNRRDGAATPMNDVAGYQSRAAVPPTSRPRTRPKETGP